MRFSVAGTVVLLLFAFSCARANASTDDMALDTAALTLMETHAQTAAPREQCFLYTELVQIYTERAGRELADGEVEKANTTLRRVQHFADLIHADLARDSKRVKEAEKTMHMASYLLAQYVHRVSADDKSVAESTLKKLNAVHDELLTQVFAH